MPGSGAFLSLLIHRMSHERSVWFIHSPNSPPRLQLFIARLQTGLPHIQLRSKPDRTSPPRLTPIESFHTRIPHRRSKKPYISLTRRSIVGRPPPPLRVTRKTLLLVSESSLGTKWRHAASKVCWDGTYVAFELPKAMTRSCVI